MADKKLNCIALLFGSSAGAMVFAIVAGRFAYGSAMAFITRITTTEEMLLFQFTLFSVIASFFLWVFLSLLAVGIWAWKRRASGGTGQKGDRKRTGPLS
jgi:hypothetical protein